MGMCMPAEEFHYDTSDVTEEDIITEMYRLLDMLRRKTVNG